MPRNLAHMHVVHVADNTVVTSPVKPCLGHDGPCVLSSNPVRHSKTFAPLLKAINGRRRCVSHDRVALQRKPRCNYKCSSLAQCQRELYLHQISRHLSSDTRVQLEPSIPPAYQVQLALNIPILPLRHGHRRSGHEQSLTIEHQTSAVPPTA